MIFDKYHHSTPATAFFLASDFTAAFFRLFVQKLLTVIANGLIERVFEERFVIIVVQLGLVNHEDIDELSVEDELDTIELITE